VGKAVFVMPGRSAALNCWHILNVSIRPLSVTNTLIARIKVDESDGRRRAIINNTGYDEFKACLPMVTPGEHVGAVRRI